jgi:hypothetical protein
VPLIKSGSPNWPWSTKILAQFVTCMKHKFICQSDVKHIMTSQMKTITSVLKASTDIITSMIPHILITINRLIWLEMKPRKQIHVKYCWQTYYKSIGTLSQTFKNHIHNNKEIQNQYPRVMCSECLSCFPVKER